MSDLTPAQRDVVRRSLKRARRKHAGPKVTKSLLETLSVESNFQDLDYGDRDSEGALQQRPSQGWGPASETLEQDVDQYLEKAMKLRHKASTAGQLAQMVQRSAFPDRYDQKSALANKLMRGQLGGGPGSPAPASTRSVQAPGESRAPARVELALDYLNDKADVLDLATGLKRLQDVPGEVIEVPTLGAVKRRGSAKRTHLSGKDPASAGRAAVELAAARNFKVVSEVRDPQRNAAVGGAKGSDHLPGRDRHAWDFGDGTPSETPEKEKLAKAIAKKYGVKFVKNSYESGGIIKVGGRRMKVQILYGAGIDHADHVHTGLHFV